MTVRTPAPRKPGAVTTGLAGIVAAARSSLPASTGVVARAQARIERGEVRVVLADVSESMLEMVGHRTKVDMLREAIRPLTSSVRVVAFGSIAEDVSGGALPPPGGSTALHLALDRARAHDATHVLVVSDGHPDDPQAALVAADRLGRDVRIDVIYIGPEDDRKGMAFMRRLARGGGAARAHSMTREPQRLAAEVRRLALPAR